MGPPPGPPDRVRHGRSTHFDIDTTSKRPAQTQSSRAPIIGDARKFKANGPGWVRMSELQRLLGLRRAAFDLLRDELGYAGEREEKTAQGSPVWVDFRTWLAAYTARERTAKGLSSTDKAAVDRRNRMEEIKLRNLELDLDERERKHLAHKPEYISLEEISLCHRVMFGGFRTFAETQLNDEQRREYCRLMDEAFEEVERFENERQQQALAAGHATDAVRGGHPPREEPGGSESPRRRAKGSRSGKATARA